jgi:hypothetical protein
LLIEPFLPALRQRGYGTSIQALPLPCIRTMFWVSVAAFSGDQWARACRGSCSPPTSSTFTTNARMRRFSAAVSGRGEVIEIFPAHYEDSAWRVSIFRDEIETISE